MISSNATITSTCDLTLHGSLLLPDQTEQPCPVALIIAGSGPTDRDSNNPHMTNNCLKYLAEELAKQGIASLRYDKRGIGKSRPTSDQPAIAQQDLRIEHYSTDAKNWIKQLSQDPRFTENYVIGHSEGALVAMLALQEITTISGFISIAGAGRCFDEIIYQQLNAQSPELAEQTRPLLKKLTNKKTVKQYPEQLQALFHPSIQLFLISLLQYKPTELMAKLIMPSLIIQGDRDLQISTEDAELLAKSQPKATAIVIPEMNHVLKISGKSREDNIALYQSPNIPIAKKLTQHISQFIRQQQNHPTKTTH